MFKDMMSKKKAMHGRWGQGTFSVKIIFESSSASCPLDWRNWRMRSRQIQCQDNFQPDAISQSSQKTRPQRGSVASRLSSGAHCWEPIYFDFQRMWFPMFSRVGSQLLCWNKTKTGNLAKKIDTVWAANLFRKPLLMFSVYFRHIL